MRGDARALGVGGVDGGFQCLCGPARGEVAGVAIDPVADELDPAVTAARLLAHVRDEIFGLDLVGVVTDVALGAGDVAAGADDAGQVVTFVDPVRVDG